MCNLLEFSDEKQGGFCHPFLLLRFSDEVHVDQRLVQLLLFSKQYVLMRVIWGEGMSLTLSHNKTSCDINTDRQNRGVKSIGQDQV